MDNLAAIFGAVRHWLKVAFEVHTIERRDRNRIGAGAPF